MRTWVDIATLAKTKNMQGGFVAQSAASLPFLLEVGMEVVFVPPAHDAPRHARVTSITQGAHHSAVVAFDQVNDIDTAEALVRCHCLVRRNQVPPEALLTACENWSGWEAYDVHAGLVGSIVGIEEMPGQDLMQIAVPDEDRIVLVPLVDAFVVTVDEGARRVDLDVPAGLLEL